MSPPVLIAGPCLLEGPELVQKTAAMLMDQLQRGCQIYFKGSFDKANRSSVDGSRGPGLEVGLALLQHVKEEFGLPVCTDVHEITQVEAVAAVADIIQIPAFLSRQSDLLRACASTGKAVNLKKGQFMDTTQALLAYEKLERYGARQAWITERGTSFGHGDLVVDFRVLIELISRDVPVMYDVTHSVQKPAAAGTSSGGARMYAAPLARAAAAIGVENFFIETHPDPDNALSDKATQLPFPEFKTLAEELFPSS